MTAGFGQDDFQNLEELKGSLADLEAIQARQLKIEQAVLHPGALKNNYYPDDVTYKGIIRDDKDLPAAFLLCSNPIGRELVAQNVEQARIAKESLSSDLQPVIDLPFASGAYKEISWALYDVHRPLSDRKFVWRVQRCILSPWIITWLNRVLAQTKTELSEQDLHDRVRVPLQFFQKEYKFSEDMLKRAASALKRLDDGCWRPCACLAHNDLW